MKTSRAFLRQLIVSFIALAFATTALAADGKKPRLLIVGQGPDGHPPTTHEFMAGAEVLAELLKPAADIDVTVTRGDEPWADGPKLIDAADGVVLLVSQGAQWMQLVPERLAAFQRLAARGGAIVALHWSIGAKEAKYIQGQLELLGATRGGPQRKYVVLATELKSAAPGHPVLSGLGDFKAYDEIYYVLDRVPGVQPLLTAQIDGKDEMAAWAWERPDGGRAFGFVGLHFHSNWQMPEYRRFVVQGVRWALKLPIPPQGVKVDIDSKRLELNGVLPMPAGPEAVKKALELQKAAR
jgi:type 1 glutamine amidotransferase